MSFNIPENLGVFTAAGLEDLLRVATAELNSLRAGVADPETIDNETLTQIQGLHDFALAAQSEIQTRRDRARTFAGLEVPALPAAEPVAPVETVTAAAPAEPVAEPVIEGTIVAASAPAPRVGISDMAVHAPAAEVAVITEPTPWLGEFHSLVAANNIPGVSDGREFADWADFARAFSNRTRTFGGSQKMQYPIAELRRDIASELTLTEGLDDAGMQRVLEHAADETRLPNGSLVAANGWCAPSENLYSTCLQIAVDGLWQGPEVIARRGGIRHNQGIEFDTIFGTGTGFNELTEAQVIADVTKTCVEIPCPPFVDDRLKVTVLCLTGAILQNRAYPEFVSTFVQGALATYAHFVNREIIADIVAGSTAVTLDADPFTSDLTVVSQVLGAVEVAIVDIQYRLRMAQGSTIEIVLPYWLKALFRQDFSRRTGFDGVSLADSEIEAWFAQRQARVQWVYDWQDAFSGVATGPGADTAAKTLPALVTPKQLQFLAYPAGTWVLARLDVIRLEAIYDSVNLPQNLVTQLFMEDGWAAMRMCPLSRVYTVDICPSGATTSLRTVTCTDIT
jgi:hypothetical protein